ncbi:MAG: response regulator transcription factor [Patescibacteria group bacterium]
MKILLIEDEKGISNLIKEGLRLENFLVDAAFTGREGIDMALINQYDLIILDLMLPDMDGLNVCKELRKNKLALPVLMLTARKTTDDIISGLDSGADDYLTKPFEFDELMARIRALLRRGQKNATGNLLKLGELNLNTKTHEVVRQGKVLDLTNKEYKLLEYLIRRPNEVINRQEILEHVWETDTDPFSNTVEVHIRYLRQKIDQDFDHKMIKTIRGAGYKLSE